MPLAALLPSAPARLALSPSLSLALAALVFLSLAPVQAQQPVPVGPGSYAEYPLIDEHDGLFQRFALSAEIDVLPGETRPIPTNDWWTSVLHDDNDQHGGQLWAYPLVADPTPEGVNVFYPMKWNDESTRLLVDYPLIIKAARESFRPVKGIATDWSDWSVTVRNHETLDDKYIEFTAAHGIPFLWFEAKGITPQIEVVHNPKVLDQAGNPVTFPMVTDGFIIHYWDLFYGIHLPPGTTVSFERPGTLTLEMPAAKTFSVSALPSPADFPLFHKHAYARPTSTRLDWEYSPEQGTVTSTWTVTTEDLRGDGEHAVLQGFLPHHYRDARMDFEFNGREYFQTRGLMKLATGNSFTITQDFNGILPWVPSPARDEGDVTPYDPEIMARLVSRYTERLTSKDEFSAADTYWGGKDMVRIAKHMLIARETGHPDYPRLLEIIKGIIADWCTYTPGETERYFARYPKWKGIVGFNESYYSGLFTDHHFHYGYLIEAAALVGMADPEFVRSYEEMLTLIVKEYANWDREDPEFPWLRTMDPWIGHSYAGGLGAPIGNNQESTAESVQSWAAMFFLGELLGNEEMRDAAAFGHNSETRATMAYWFNAHGDLHPGYKEPIVGILWNGSYVYATFFGANPLFIHGIQMLPISPAFNFWARDLSPAEAVAHYEDLLVREHRFRLKDEKQKERTADGKITEDEVGHDWGHVLLGFRQMFDPEHVTALFQRFWESEDKSERAFVHEAQDAAITYYVAHSTQNLGFPRFDSHLGIPTSAAYYHAGRRETTFVVFNPSAEMRDCTVFHDGKPMGSLEVPGGTLLKAPASRVVAP